MGSGRGFKVRDSEAATRRPRCGHSIRRAGSLRSALRSGRTMAEPKRPRRTKSRRGARDPRVGLRTLSGRLGHTPAGRRKRSSRSSASTSFLSGAVDDSEMSCPLARFSSRSTRFSSAVSRSAPPSWKMSFPSPTDVRAGFDALPSFDVSVTLKTSYHRDAAHRPTTNDIHDIDALGFDRAVLRCGRHGQGRCQSPPAPRSRSTHEHRLALISRRTASSP